MSVSLPIVSSHVAMGENTREVDAVRFVENRRRYESFYDAWANESPAAMNEQFTAELRARLKGGDVEN